VLSVGVDHELELIRAASQHHSLLTITKVRELGISEARWARLRHAEVWIEMVPGVWRHAATPRNWQLEVRAGSLWLGKEAGLHAAAALRWLGVEGCENATADFLVPRSRRHVPQWMNIHTTTSWSRGDFVRKDGVLCSTATRAIIDLAATAAPRVVESAIDGAIRMRLTSVPTLTSRMRELAGPGRTGTRLLRALLLDSGGESTMERAFLKLVRQHGLPRPATQVAYRTDTNLAIRVDFEYLLHGVVVEVSGRRGHASDSDRRHDARRRNELQRRGKKVIEFTTADVLEDQEYVVRTLREHLPAMV
jgi:very-short-patch-repair endonuclease